MPNPQFDLGLNQIKYDMFDPLVSAGTQYCCWHESTYFYRYNLYQPKMYNTYQQAP